MSQALYRRYRPETFADVIGQEHVTEPLMQALRTGRVGHAYLFSGPRGCGKTTSARILARCLNCEGGPTDAPCGTCDSCVALARGGSGTVDVIEIDAASHGGVDDARELRERASYGPAQSRYKIYIIDEAHMVTPQGFNALLKIVEEPPEHVKFVFATTEPEKVIGTIRSRTHHYPFRLVPPAQLQDYLAALCQAEGVAVEPGVLSFVVRAGGGSVRDSLSVLDQLIAGSGDAGLTYDGAAALLGFTDAELLDATVTAIAYGDPAAAFSEVNRVIETGLDPRRFVEDLLERLRDLIICAALPDGAAAVLRGTPADQLERMHVQAAAFGPGGLSRAADVVNAGLAEMTGATAPRLQLELIIARLLLPGAAGPQGYAARIDRIERRLDMGVREAGAAPPPPTDQPPQTPRREPAPQTPVPAPAAPGGPAPAGSERPQGSPPSPQGPQSSGPQPQEAPQPPSGQRQQTGSVTPAVPQPGDASRPRTTGALDQAAVLRAWPDILDWLSRHKRVVWTMVSANAKPLSFDGSRLVLAIETTGLAETFRRSAHHAFVQEALLEVLGIDATVEGVVSETARDGGRASGGEHGGGPVTTPAAVGGQAAETAPQQAPRPDQRPAGHSGPPPASPVPPTPAPQSAAQPTSQPTAQPTWGEAPPPPISAPSWATGGEDPLGRAPSASRPPAVSEATSPVAVVDDPDAISDDDEDIEATGDVGLSVVERLLGGTVISEDES